MPFLVTKLRCTDWGQQHWWVIYTTVGRCLKHWHGYTNAICCPDNTPWLQPSWHWVMHAWQGDSETNIEIRWREVFSKFPQSVLLGDSDPAKVPIAFFLLAVKDSKTATTAFLFFDVAWTRFSAVAFARSTKNCMLMVTNRAHARFENSADAKKNSRCRRRCRLRMPKKTCDAVAHRIFCTMKME